LTTNRALNAAGDRREAAAHELPQAAGYRLARVSTLAAAIGALVGGFAYALYSLIGLFTNIAFYHEWPFHFRGPRNCRWAGE
jgi:hypothetical protein